MRFSLVGAPPPFVHRCQVASERALRSWVFLPVPPPLCSHVYGLFLGAFLLYSHVCMKDYLLSESEKFHVLASCSAGDRIVLECVLKKAHAITETHIHALEAFISMNREGFRKILKKWDKVHNKTDSVSRMRMINNILVDPVTELDMLIAGATPKTREWSDTKRGRFMAFVSRPLVLTSIVFVTLLVFGLVLAFGVEGSKIANTFFVGVLASFVLALANGANDIANSVVSDASASGAMRGVKNFANGL